MVPDGHHNPTVTCDAEPTFRHILRGLEASTVGLQLRAYVEEVEGYDPDAFDKVEVASVWPESVDVKLEEEFVEVWYRDIERIHVY